MTTYDINTLTRSGNIDTSGSADLTAETWYHDMKRCDCISYISHQSLLLQLRVIKLNVIGYN